MPSRARLVCSSLLTSNKPISSAFLGLCFKPCLWATRLCAVTARSNSLVCFSSDTRERSRRAEEDEGSCAASKSAKSLLARRTKGCGIYKRKVSVQPSDSRRVLTGSQGLCKRAQYEHLRFRLLSHSDHEPLLIRFMQRKQQRLVSFVGAVAERGAIWAGGEDAAFYRCVSSETSSPGLDYSLWT